MILIIALAFFACDDKGDTHTHEWGAWQYNATEHWKECTANDGAKTDIAPHTAGDWIIDPQATYDTDGSRHKKCTVCEYIIETETIPMTHTHEWEWVVTEQATPTADGLETETCKTCGAESGNTRIIEQTEPTVKTFSVSFDFQNVANPGVLYDATIKDERTACGKQNLEQLGIVTVIEEAIQGAYNNIQSGSAGNAMKGRFRIVFGVENGVTIYVDNTATTYKVKAPDNKTIRFHINYLQSNSATIQQEIRDAVTAMNTGGDQLPYYVEQ